MKLGAPTKLAAPSKPMKLGPPKPKPPEDLARVTGTTTPRVSPEIGFSTAFRPGLHALNVAAQARGESWGLEHARIVEGSDGKKAMKARVIVGGVFEVELPYTLDDYEPDVRDAVYAAVAKRLRELG